MKNIFKLLLVSLIFTACEDVEPTIYNGTQDDPTLLSFASSSVNLPVQRDGAGSVTLVLNSSTVSSVDRVYALDINEEDSTADPAIYTFPSTIIIPAGSYQGTAVVTAQDINVDENRETIVFSITDVQGAFMDTEVITVTIFEVCLVNAPFVGQYTVEQVNSGLNIAEGGAEIFGDDGGVLPIVTIEQGASEFERTISFDAYPEAGAGFSIDWIFSLACGVTNITDTFDLGVGCDGANTLKFAPGVSGGMYDADNDESFSLTITEDSSSSCGSPRQSTLIFTKVN